MFQLRTCASILLGVALIVIGILLLYLVRRRPDMVLKRMRSLFGILAIGIGTAELLTVASDLTLAAPVSVVDAVVRLMVGLAAAGIAMVMLWVTPRFMVLPSNTSLQQAIQRLRVAEAATTQANQWLTLSEQIANVGHWRLCARSRAMTWSAEVYRIFGIASDANPLDGHAIRRAWHPDDRGKIWRAALAALRDHTDFDAEARIIRPNGQVRHILVRGLFQPPTEGRDAGLFGICFDRTEQKRIEQDLEQARAIAEQAMQRLEEQALQDSLTGLANRRRFDAALDGEFRRVKRLGLPLSLVMIDVDNFKQYNDLYGHPAGDECLHAIAVEISKPLRRPGDLAARYGGEELAILMPAVTLAGATLIAEKIVAAMRDLAIEHQGSATGVVTISAGVAVIEPAVDDPDPLPLLRQADTALYDAKRNGRNQVCVFQPELVSDGVIVALRA